jgi:hypothetical protein
MRLYKERQRILEEGIGKGFHAPSYQPWRSLKGDHEESRKKRLNLPLSLTEYAVTRINRGESRGSQT